jgi:predicted MPP superfamily phosphohydrolase
VNTDKVTNADVLSLQNQISMEQNEIAAENATLLNDQVQLATYKTELAQTLLELNQTALELTATLSNQNAVENQISVETALINSLNSTITAENTEINLLNQKITTLTSMPATPDAADGFSVVQITDTQYLSDSNPALFDGLTSWIVNESAALNLNMVVHTGDIVQVSNSTTDWQNANTAMMQLYNAGIPYCWDAGNHDQLNSSIPGGGGDPNGNWIGCNYPAFKTTIMSAEPYWVGSCDNGKDTAVQFVYGNYHFMVINLEYDANQTAIDWMENLITANPTVNIIVATHNFLNAAGTYGYPVNPNDIAWATRFESILQNYPNVFMTMNGHNTVGGYAYNIKVGNIEECFFNRQEYDNQQGAATARIYVFNMANPSKPTIDAYTYQTFGTPQYLTDPVDQFSFSSNLIPYSR